MGLGDWFKNNGLSIAGGVLGTMTGNPLLAAGGAALGSYIKNKDPKKALVSGGLGYLAGPALANMGSNIYDAATYTGPPWGEYDLANSSGGSPMIAGEMPNTPIPSPGVQPLPTYNTPNLTPGMIGTNLANYFKGGIENLGEGAKNIGSKIGDFFGGSGNTGNSNLGSMAALLGSQYLGSNAQSDMMQQLADAQNQSYQKYLGSINPPDAVKDARFNELQSQVLTQAPIMQRRISDAAASRGIKGQGILPEIASGEKGVQDAINKAYFNVYGDYNVPNQPPPVNFAPSTGNLMGSNIGDLLSMLSMQKIINPRG